MAGATWPRPLREPWVPSFGLSVLCHALALAFVWWMAAIRLGPSERPTIYRVELVELDAFEPPVTPPAGVDEPIETPAPPPAAAPPEPVAEPTPTPLEPPPLEGRRRSPSARRPEAPAPAAAAQPLAVSEPTEVAPPPAAPAVSETPVPPVEPPAATITAEAPAGASTQDVPESPLFTEYAYYRVAMRNKIAAAWSPPPAGAEMVCSVRFRIVRSGHLTGAQLATSSGLPWFDQTALRAVAQASPLPPLPADFPDDQVGVLFHFIFKP